MAKRIWSEYQRAVFRDIAEGVGHTVVKARAGCAKTSTIVEGFNHVPRGLMTAMFAFNKSIAEELAELAPPGVEVSTLHSYGYKACRRAYPKAKVNKHRTMHFATELYEDDPETYPKRLAFCKLVSLAKAALVESREGLEAIVAEHEIDVPTSAPGEIPDMPPGYEDETPEDPKVEEFFNGALRCLKQQRTKVDCIDFDDMIWLPVVNKLYTWKFDRVFIDETQDLNPCQIELALRSVKPKGRIMAVGDDRQAIYGFRGADSNAVDNVIERLKAKVLPLSITYRCARSIVNLAKEIVHDYECAPTAIDGEVSDSTLKQMFERVAPGDFILSRTNAPLIGLCLTLIREGRRANIQGRDVGTALSSIVREAEKDCDNILEFTDWLRTWYTTVHQQAEKLKRDTQVVEDKYECLVTLSEGARSLREVLGRIEQLFSDDDNKNRIILSTTHKAKGLERDRVFVLSQTYMTRPGVEEVNLWYVAITRARQVLVRVTDQKFAPKRRKTES